MSMFFFRFHNLRREEQNKRLKTHMKMSRECGPPSPSSTRSETRPVYGHYTNAIITGAGRLFEKPPLYPSDSLDEIALQIPRVRVEYYVNENTFKERLQLYFIKNQRSSLRIRIVNLFLKLLTCVLYMVRVIMDSNPTHAACYGCNLSEKLDIRRAANLTEEQFQDNPIINWDAILWVNRPHELWLIQVIIAYISLAQALLLVYLGYKGNIRQQLLSRIFILEMVNTVPFTITVFHPTLRNLFIPVFLNCWLAKNALQNMFNDLHRAMQRSQSALSQQLMILSATLLCLVFTSVCGVQHFQRAGHRHLDLFQATYYVVVTFSTVGYGDFVPDIWPSQLYMVLMICIALIVLPTQFEQLAFTWMERQKLGGSYSSHRAQSEKHVVVCCTSLHSDTIMDFLNEFYAHPRLQDHYVVLLSPMELDNTMRMILQVPIWSQRVIYIQGSCLKDSDLGRARMNAAEACFILAARNYADKAAADEHTILRAWAVKDFASKVEQYVQILRPENKIHVKFAKNVICEDELKYSLLAINCTVLGISTFVTLLLHTSRGQEGQTSNEEWQRLYGRCSGNEVYHIRLADSRFFGEYEGKSFTYASFHSHRKYGVSLVGVRPAPIEDDEEPLSLNPGPRHVMHKSDICFYLSITKEENSSFVVHPSKEPAPMLALEPKMSHPEGRSGTSGVAGTDGEDTLQSKPSITVQIETASCSELTPLRSDGAGNLLNVPRSGEMSLLSPDTSSRRGSRRPSILPVPDNLAPSRSASDEDDDEDNSEDDDLLDTLPWATPCENIKVVKGFPPISPYIGVNPTLCYLLREKKPLCCLQLTQPCEHCDYRTAHEYNWPNKAIILAADYASKGIYNFVIPLRAHFRAKASLHPIVLLLERRPDPAFLDALAHFPIVYWMLGSIDSLDDLLRAGIIHAKTVVVVNKELSNSAEEDTLADCNTILSVQTMFKFFPDIASITELSQSSNMRFMHFRPHDKYALHLSKMEKNEKERGSHISYMFRLPFASGNVFSASMLDTLLYQAFVKDYVITFVRLLLGVDQTPGSGFLTTMTITKDDMWIRTYGRLYQKLCSTTFEIPIGIYRTEDAPDSDGCLESDRDSFRRAHKIERAEIANLVRSRMEAMNLPPTDYDADAMDKPAKISYVIINPSCDLKLHEGDMIYLIAPSPFSARKTFERHNSRRKSNISHCSQQLIQQMSSQRVVTGSAATRPPSLASMKATSLSLPDSPQQLPFRGRSSSLRVCDDILLRRSSSLRQGINYRRKSSLEDVGLAQPLKIALNQSIDLEVTPPEDQVRPTLV